MRRRIGTGRNSTFGSRALTFFLILILAVGAGYAMTKYVITPYFIGDKDQGDTNTNTPPAENFSGSAIITSQQQTTGNDTVDQTIGSVDSNITSSDQVADEWIETITLYCIQYGSFQSNEGALAVVASLDSQNIESIVLNNGGFYKVIGAPYTKEDAARKAMESQKITIGDDLFITTLEAKIQ